MPVVSNEDKLKTPIEYLKGVGPARAEILKKELNIFTFNDLLQYLPFRYIDRSRIYTAGEIIPEHQQQYIQLKGKISGLQTLGAKRGKRLTARLTDETGSVELIWFRGIRWIKKYLKPNAEYIVFGKPSFFNGKISFPHPEMENAAAQPVDDQRSLQPVYSTTEKLKSNGLDSKGILKLQRNLHDHLKNNAIPEILPESMIYKYKFIPRYGAFQNIHFPENEKKLDHAIRRLKFEELFLIQISLLQMKELRLKSIKGFVFPSVDQKFKQFYENQLEFELTGAQKRVLKEIRQDTLSGKQMNRLLQGDVGSGKTIVALMTMLMAVDNGFQAALMAPTEILAQQHLQTLTSLLSGMDIKVALLTGSVKGKKRKEILDELQQGNIDILIGTHALIEDTVKYKNIGLVVIDEQHRFGVAQRAQMWKKNTNPPHVLVMTATPIPRTLAMTVYGDLDTSVIDEMPPGRKPVRTVHRYDSNRLRVFGFIKEQISLGRQVYIVYPLIEESSKMDYKNLMEGFDVVTESFPKPQYHVSIVHGKMKPEEKEVEMNRFAEGKTHIMVATTVIEVGVNIPNATVMIIESAERFGLSQLHQLRGRVGRGGDQSYCILMTGKKLSNDARKRLRTMVSTNNGFVIAEADMQLRGPGEMEGTRQSGMVNLRLADLTKDEAVLKEARKAASEIMEEDFKLQKPANKPLKKYLQREKKQQVTWGRIS